MKTELVKETFLKDLIIVTGAPSSGKSLLSPIVSSLERTENFKMSVLLEQLGTLNYLNKLEDDVIVFLFRYVVDFMLYDNMIGRNLNFRFGDETSIFNTNDPEIYFDRLLAERGGFVVDEIKMKRPLLVLGLTDALWHGKRWFEAFPFLKIIHTRRHPVDNVYSWYNHRFGDEVKLSKSSKKNSITYGYEGYNSSINQVFLIRRNNKIIPYYASGWEDEYINMCSMDRVIHMINTINKNYSKTLNSFSKEERSNVLLLKHDETVVNTETTLKKICSFLKTNETKYTSVIIKREQCPRTLKKSVRDKKRDKIKELASDECFSLLNSMVKDYRSWGKH